MVDGHRYCRLTENDGMFAQENDLPRRGSHYA
jgi:hypothetical protein